MSILIGLPCYTGVSDRTAVGLFDLGKFFLQNGIAHKLLTVTNSSLISKCRSRMANLFLHGTQYEYLLFIDSDIGFSPPDVAKLIELQVPFATAAYSMKTVPPRYNFKTRLVDGKIISNPSGTAIQVDHIGAGFMLIHRKVFEGIARKFPELRFRPEPASSHRAFTEAELNESVHFFETFIDPVTRADLSEDLAFCWRARQAGFDIWMRLDTELTHTGNFTYTGVDLKAELGELVR